MDEKVKAKKKAKKINTIGNSKNIADKCNVGVIPSVGDNRLKCEIEPKVTIKLCDIGSADVETRNNPVSLLEKQIYKVRLEVYGESAEHILNQMERYYRYIKEKGQENRVKLKP